MTKLEEIARAIYEGRNGSGCKAWGRLPDAHKAPYRSDALYAVRAMRDVDDPTMLACWLAVAKDEDDPTDEEIIAIWQAGVDSILSEAGEKP